MCKRMLKDLSIMHLFKATFRASKCPNDPPLNKWDWKKNIPTVTRTCFPLYTCACAFRPAHIYRISPARLFQKIVKSTIMFMQFSAHCIFR